MPIEIIEQGMENGHWINIQKSSFSYDVNNNLLEEFVQLWDIENEVWIIGEKHLFTYDDKNNLIQELHQDGQEDFLSIYSYNDSNNLIEKINKVWNGITWMNSVRYDLIYGADNNLIELCEQNWSGDNWVNFWKYSYTYSSITTIKQDDNTPDIYQLSQNYPNPFNPTTNINYKLPKTSQVELGIYNLLGQKVATLVDKKQAAGTYTVQWEASGFSSGVYYYKIEAGEFSETKKLVLLK